MMSQSCVEKKLPDLESFLQESNNPTISILHFIRSLYDFCNYKQKKKNPPYCIHSPLIYLVNAHFLSLQKKKTSITSDSQKKKNL